MSESTGVFTQEPPRELRIVAGLLAVGVAGVHLFHPRLGAIRLIEYLDAGVIFNPLPVLFTFASLLIVTGIILVYNGVMVRLVYAFGIVLMIVFLLGYALWHTALDHGAFWPHIHGHGHADRGPLWLLWAHLRTDPIGMFSKLLELLLAATLAMLYLLEGPQEPE